MVSNLDRLVKKRAIETKTSAEARLQVLLVPAVGTLPSLSLQDSGRLTSEGRRFSSRIGELVPSADVKNQSQSHSGSAEGTVRVLMG
jgi:hypothetical protein